MLPGFPDFSKVGEAAEILGARAASADASITEIRELLIVQNALLGALLFQRYNAGETNVSPAVLDLAKNAVVRATTAVAPAPVGEGSTEP